VSILHFSLRRDEFLIHKKRFQEGGENMKVDLLLTPGELDHLPRIKGKTGVVIDVIRTTTTITTAFKNGCLRIIPVLTVEEAFARKAGMKSRDVLLGGAQSGEKIEGFDLGNSPLEYKEERIKNKTVILRTTNGTKTLKKISDAEDILIASFMNIQSVVSALIDLNRDVVIVCSGLRGLFSLEDTVCAGMIVERLKKEKGESLEWSDSSFVSSVLAGHFQKNLLRMLEESEWGRHLANKGWHDDLKACAEVDSVAFVPRMQRGKIIV
jgi:2-phosphosulfolactate phosphatase